MQNHKREFIDVWGDAKENCVEIEALLSILKNYCEVNDDDDQRFFYIEVILDVILNKNLEQIEQINDLERCANNFIF